MTTTTAPLITPQMTMEQILQVAPDEFLRRTQGSVVAHPKEKRGLAIQGEARAVDSQAGVDGHHISLVGNRRTEEQAIPQRNKKQHCFD